MAYEAKHVPISQAAFSYVDIRPPAGETWILHSIAGYPGYLTPIGMPGTTSTTRLGASNDSFTLANAWIGSYDYRSIWAPTGGTDTYLDYDNYLNFQTHSGTAVSYVLLVEKVNKPGDDETWKLSNGLIGAGVAIDHRPPAGKAYIYRGFAGHMMYCGLRPRTATAVATGNGFGTGSGPAMRPKSHACLYATNTVYFQVYNRDTASQYHHLTYVEVEEPEDMVAVAFEQAAGTVEVRPPAGEQWIAKAQYSGTDTQSYHFQFTMDGSTFYSVASLGAVPRLSVPMTNSGWLKTPNNASGGLKYMAYVKVS